MTTSILNSNETDAVLTDFAHAIEGNSGSAVLADYAARYPDLARDFGRIAQAEWETQNGLTPNRPLLTETETATAARFREIGLAAMRNARPALAAATTANAPVQSLLDAAKARGLSRQDLASRLQLPDTLLLKLHRRLIVAASVPGELVGKLADAIGRTNEEIAAYLRQPAQMPVGASFRADNTPQAQTETFMDALLSDPDATPEHKAAWFDDSDPRRAGTPQSSALTGGTDGGESDRAA